MESLLLHFAGPAIQDIFNTLPDLPAVADGEVTRTKYDMANGKLNRDLGYDPNTAFECHSSRRMTQLEVERQNRSLLTVLPIANDEGLPLQQELTRYLAAYRAIPHPATGRAPASLLFNRRIRSKLPSMEMPDDDMEVREANAKANATTVPSNITSLQFASL